MHVIMIYILHVHSYTYAYDDGIYCIYIHSIHPFFPAHSQNELKTFGQPALLNIQLLYKWPSLTKGEFVVL